MNQETVREDQGYKKYPINKNIVMKPDKIRIRLLNGDVFEYAEEFANDLIRRGKGQPA